MNKGIKKMLGAAMLCGAFSVSAFAQGAQGCIALKSVAQVETEVTNEKGEKVKKLVAADKVVPGTEVIFTVTANNTCKQASEKVVIDNPVPSHMTYVSNSAFGANSTIVYSLDGKTFGAPSQLSVTENGAARAARAEEYRHIRWEFKNPLQPGASANATFRAVLN